MIEDEEVDFMSDEFLEQCTKNDVRPGLLFKQSDKRKHEHLKKIKPKQTEESHREAGLNKEIGRDNKGFRMLEKMGFKSGESIGKRPAARVQLPIPIEVKRGRVCLGQKTKVEEKQKNLEALGDVNSFRSRLQTSSAAAIRNWDLSNTQRICQNLDEKAGILVPCETWYWPKPKSSKQKQSLVLTNKEAARNEVANSDSDDQESDESDNTPEPHDQLKAVVNHLRRTYFYCVWCGTEFNDEEDLFNSCPGSSREEH